MSRVKTKREHIGWRVECWRVEEYHGSPDLGVLCRTREDAVRYAEHVARWLDRQTQRPPLRCGIERRRVSGEMAWDEGTLTLPRVVQARTITKITERVSVEVDGETYWLDEVTRVEGEWETETERKSNGWEEWRDGPVRDDITVYIAEKTIEFFVEIEETSDAE